MTPTRRVGHLSIALPSSVVSEHSHLRQKTNAIGLIGRVATLYRVEKINIYRDDPDEAQLIRLILNYMETPQYLRRRLIRKRQELSYAGTLPPLRTPHHPTDGNSRRLKKGGFREGVVVSEEEDTYIVDIGVERTMKVRGRAPSIGSRVTVQVTGVDSELKGRFAKRKEIDEYWGYEVHISDSLLELVTKDTFDLKIGTSRLGSNFKDIEKEMGERWMGAKDILVIFGSPHRGLTEMLPKGKDDVGSFFDFTVNMIPGQGSETVRTEEAMHATLAVLNLI
jgi:predicted SPOUT superfamily RNA methylase MTH1